LIEGVIVLAEKSFKETKIRDVSNTNPTGATLGW
jgi:hypothetical protein